MNNNTFMFGIIAALVVGSGVGYSYGKGVGGDMHQSEELQGAVSMMSSQSVAIEKMGGMMKSGGMMMQEMGAQYKDESMMSLGKDLEVIGEKYMKENAMMMNGSMMKSMH